MAFYKKILCIIHGHTISDVSFPYCTVCKVKTISPKMKTPIPPPPKKVMILNQKNKNSYFMKKIKLFGEYQTITYWLIYFTILFLMCLFAAYMSNLCDNHM